MRQPKIETFRGLWTRHVQKGSEASIGSEPVRRKEVPIAFKAEGNREIGPPGARLGRSGSNIWDLGHPKPMR